MAYNRKNLLKRMIDIQEVYLLNSKNHKGGCTDKYIFEDLVAPVYHISRKTFYDYLGTNAKQELKNIAESEKEQLSLFELETI